MWHKKHRVNFSAKGLQLSNLRICFQAKIQLLRFESVQWGADR